MKTGDLRAVPAPTTVPCQCLCGYTCGRACRMAIDDCLDLHYRSGPCGHQWDGPVKLVAQGATVTCSRCGADAIEHARRVGP